MGEIKFRGKTKSGEWLYGFLVVSRERPGRTAHFIITDDGQCNEPHTWVLVTPESVGQCTGLKNKAGTEIYEGDILRHDDEAYRVDSIVPLHRHTHVTNIGYFDMSGKYHTRDNPAGQYDNGDDWMSWTEMYEAIGNVTDNPDLLSK